MRRWGRAALGVVAVMLVGLLAGGSPARAEDGCRVIVVDLGNGRSQLCTVCVVGWWSQITCR